MLKKCEFWLKFTLKMKIISQKRKGVGKMDFNLRAISILKKAKNVISVFGSSRISIKSKEYEEARSLAHKLGICGYSIITGGGEGIMRAANEGLLSAKAALQDKLTKKSQKSKIFGGEAQLLLNNFGINFGANSDELGIYSFGANTKLPNEQELNKFVEIGMHFSNLSERKRILCDFSRGFVFCAGGFGTLDELGEVLVRRAIEQIKAPIILYKSEFWSKLLEWLENSAQQGLIPKEQMKFLQIAENEDEVLQILRYGKITQKSEPSEVLGIESKIENKTQTKPKNSENSENLKAIESKKEQKIQSKKQEKHESKKAQKHEQKAITKHSEIKQNSISKKPKKSQSKKIQEKNAESKKEQKIQAKDKSEKNNAIESKKTESKKKKSAKERKK